MEIVCSVGGIVDEAYPRQGIADLEHSGFERVLLDLNRYCSIEDIRPLEGDRTKREPFDGERMRQRFGQLVDGLREKGLQASLGTAPYLAWNTKRKDLDDLLLRAVGESIRACEEAGCGAVVIRPLFSGVEAGCEWEVNRAWYLELARACQRGGTKLLLQNLCHNRNGHLVRGVCADGQEAAKWVRDLNMEAGQGRFGFCLDTGACNLGGQDMQEALLSLGDCLEAVILRDNDGINEASMLPFTAVSGGQPSTDWLGVVRGLRRICFDGYLVLDFSSTAGSFSPILRPQLLALAKAVAEYFRWQVEIEAALGKYRSIVLFGAGNMCRNFMKCYGKEYPPLFTCDNNPSLWGSEFCGLEVRPPDALKGLPGDCGVFICNIYYREIEEQLRGMGLGNIEFFNDEYMPSFHFDRLRR